MAGDKKKSKAIGKLIGDKKPTPETVIAQARAAAFVDESSERAFAHFRPLAEAVPFAQTTPFNADALLLRANITTALAAAAPHLPAAVAALREPKLAEIFELPSLVMGLDYAVSRVPVATLSTGDIEKMLAEGAVWRELMLDYLQVASHPLIGLVPRERYQAIRAGTGKLDKARDFVAIPGVFSEFAAKLEGKHPFPAGKMDLLGTLGAALLLQMSPGRALTVVGKRSPESILRDQFASLVTARYDRLQVLVSVALSSPRKAEELLPALRSAVAVSGGAVPEPPNGGGAPPG